MLTGLGDSRQMFKKFKKILCLGMDEQVPYLLGVIVGYTIDRVGPGDSGVVHQNSGENKR